MRTVLLMNLSTELQLVGEPMAPVSSFADIRSLLSVLSPREEEVLLLRLEALKYREIAEQLGISTKVC